MKSVNPNESEGLRRSLRGQATCHYAEVAQFVDGSGSGFLEKVSSSISTYFKHRMA